MWMIRQREEEENRDKKRRNKEREREMWERIIAYIEALSPTIEQVSCELWVSIISIVL